MCTWACICVCDCILSLCLLCHNVCTLPRVCMSLLLPSSFFSAQRAQNEPPTTQKQSADGGFFHMAKRLHNMTLCALYTSAHTQTWVADGGRHHTHTHTHHTLTVSLLLTQTHFEHVQTDRQCRRTHSLATPPPPTPTVASKLDPTCPRAERQKDIERDQWTQ